ncbi:MAG: DUF1932 domain-containing protein [Rhodospirillaceae bacterium]
MSTGIKAPGNQAAIAFVGFGEAASAFVRGWTEAGIMPTPVAAFDIKTDDASADVAQAKRDASAVAGVAGATRLADALAGAPIVFSLVTADRSLEAAESAAAAIEPDAFFLDCNSVAPANKRAAAALIGAAGGRYVDVAVMAPVHPALHKTPLLLGGPHAPAVRPALDALDMKTEVIEADVGTASAVKMIRSVMIKGLEALTLECLLAARLAGVEDRVLDSLDKTDPGIDWRKRAAYNIERVTTHGVRRAAEMRESAKTVRDLGLSGAMTDGTVAWQQLIGDLNLPPGPDDFAARADAIMAELGAKLREEDE